MSYRVVQYHIDDFIMDYDGVAESINKACQRDHKRYRVSGVCQAGEQIVIAFEEDYDSAEWSYVVKPFPGQTARDITAEIHSRWQGKFSTRGLVHLEDIDLGIFEHAQDVREHLD